MDTVEQKQESDTPQKKRLEKNINRLASPGTAAQIALTIPSVVVELDYGIKYINQCPIQPLINVFLIVHGCSSLANGIILLIGFLTAKHLKQSPTPSTWVRGLFRVSLLAQLIYLIFSWAWLIVGQVWVFGAQTHGFQSSNSTDSSTYCVSNVFWTGFAIIIVTYAIWLIIFVVIGVRYIIKRHKMTQTTAAKIDERI